MAEDPKPLRSIASIAKQTSGPLSRLGVEWGGALFRQPIGLRSAPVFLLIGGVIGFAGYSVLKAGTHSEAENPILRTLSRVHLLEELETVGIAPSSLQAHFEWQEGRWGLALTWDPLPNKVRIYRTPSGTPRYVELDGRVARSFDTDIVPGRAYAYVACASAEQGQEYCSNPIWYEAPVGNWR